MPVRMTVSWLRSWSASQLVERSMNGLSLRARIANRSHERGRHSTSLVSICISRTPSYELATRHASVPYGFSGLFSMIEAPSAISHLQSSAEQRCVSGAAGRGVFPGRRMCKGGLVDTHILISSLERYRVELYKIAFGFRASFD